MAYEIVTGTHTRTSATLAEAFDKAQEMAIRHETDTTVTGKNDEVLLSIEGGQLHIQQPLLDRVEALRVESAEAGDLDLAVLCDEALQEENEDASNAALTKVLEAMDEAEAQDD